VRVAEWPGQSAEVLHKELANKVDILASEYKQLAGFQSDYAAKYWPAYDACQIEAQTAKAKAGERAARAAQAAIYETKGNIAALEAEVAFLRLLLDYSS
jgi:hypothetical protein